jgi:hypothetical protein
MMPELEFVVREEPNDTSIQIRVQKIGNGYVVKTGNLPVYFPTIQEAAQAIKDGLISAMNNYSRDPDDFDHFNPDHYVHVQRKSKKPS